MRAKKYLPRRRRILLFSAVPLLLVLILTVKLLSVSALGTMTAAAFTADDGPRIISVGRLSGILNIIQPAIADYNEGVGHAVNSDHPKAVEKFEDALNHAEGPFECRVRTNLVLSLEKIGDLQTGHGQTAYTRALSVIEAAPQHCFQKDNAEAGRTLESARKRMEQKETTKNSPADTEDQAPEAEQAPEESIDRLEQLKQQKRDSAQLREDARRNEQLQDGSSDEPPQVGW